MPVTAPYIFLAFLFVVSDYCFQIIELQNHAAANAVAESDPYSIRQAITAFAIVRTRYILEKGAEL